MYEHYRCILRCRERGDVVLGLDRVKIRGLEIGVPKSKLPVARNVDNGKDLGDSMVA